MKKRKPAPVTITRADGSREVVKASAITQRPRPRKRRKTFYEKYLRSEHWARLRAQRLDHDNWACTECGRRRGDDVVLQVHHLTYERVPYRELLDDLATLCDDCHRASHKDRRRR